MKRTLLSYSAVAGMLLVGTLTIPVRTANADAVDKSAKKLTKYQAEAQRLGLEINPVDGARVEEIVTGLFTLDPKLKVKLRKVLFPEKPRANAKASGNRQ